MPKELTVLLVDDKGDQYSSAKLVLRDYEANKGYDKCSLRIATTVEEGIDVLEHDQEIGLVILDINFDPKNPSNRDGIEKFLRPTREKGNKIPIICWSIDSEHRWYARKAGANEFISKDKVSELYDAMEVVLPKLEE